MVAMETNFLVLCPCLKSLGAHKWIGVGVGVVVFRFFSIAVSALWSLCVKSFSTWTSPPEIIPKSMWHLKYPPHRLEVPLHFRLPSLQGVGAHHVVGQLVSWQIFDILMLCIDDLCQLSAPDVFLKHPHGHPWVKACQLSCIATHNLGDG